jgi:FkbH-like protein
MVAVPDIGSDPASFVDLLDRQLYFEPVAISDEDRRRSSYYVANTQRNLAQATYASYGEFLDSLQMRAELGPFVPMYMDRIAQLTNKTNQFNLTTRRYTLGELEAMRVDPGCVTLYGRLADRFGDNGLVTVVVGRTAGDALDLELWLMSCRVLKRDLELAVLDELAAQARARGLRALRGSYVPTARNGLVADHYERLGFTRVAEHEWRLELDGYAPRNQHIKEILRG